MSAGTQIAGSGGSTSGTGGGGFWGGLWGGIKDVAEDLFKNTKYTKNSNGSETWVFGPITLNRDSKGNLSGFNNGSTMGAADAQKYFDSLVGSKDNTNLLLLGGAALFIIVLFAMRK